MEVNPHKMKHIHKNLRIVWFEIGLLHVDDATNMLEVASSTDIFLQFRLHFFQCVCEHLVHFTKSNEPGQLSILYQLNGPTSAVINPTQHQSKRIFEHPFTSQNAKSTLSQLATLDADYAPARCYAPSFVFLWSGCHEKPGFSIGFHKCNNYRYEYDRKNKS
jgi:hypothetical protein